METQEQLSCSIIVVAYNSCDFIPACLKSVRDACEGIDAQIIVLDNGSKEPILPEIRNFFPEVLWIDSKENLGFGKGCNLAEKHATKPYLFFINPDTVISRDSFREMLLFMKQHPESGTVGCRILNEDGSIQWACRRSFPTIISAVSKTIGLAALFPKNKTLASYNMTFADPNEMIEVDAISGSFFCIRRDVYEQLNGFDEDFFMYGEDLDLCFRTKEMGLKNYYTPVTNILHFRGQSSRTRRVKSYIDFYHAMIIFVKKHKNLYGMPYFLVAGGIMFAAFVGVFSRLIPQFWKIFLDLGVIALWALLCLNYSALPNSLDAYFSNFANVGQLVDWNLVGIIALVNVLFLFCKGEYANRSLGGFHFIRYLVPLNVIASAGVVLYEKMTLSVTQPLVHYGFELCLLSLVIPFAFLAWRRIAFWINYFYRIFAKKRHRSILLGGAEDSLQSWFDRYNVIPGIEILGCVSGECAKVSEENRPHLLGNLNEMESICNRTGCRELLVVSNFSGYREPFDINWLKKLGLNVFLLIGNGKNGNYALVDLKYLH